MIINTDDIDIEFSFRDDPDFPASAQVHIGQFKIKGFSVRKSKHPEAGKLHVFYPPSSRAGVNKYIKLVWTDKETWAELETKALQEFKEQHDAHLMNELSKHTKAKDIPM